MNGYRLVTGCVLAGWASLGLAAGAEGGGALPWDEPLTAIVGSLQGPVAAGIAAVALVVSLGTLAFSDNLSGLGRQMIYLVLVISLLVAGANLITTLFTTGASIGSGPGLRALLASAALMALATLLALLQTALARAQRRWSHRDATATNEPVN